jgi:hypothetical protein
MAKISFFKKLKLYREYRRIINQEKKTLEGTFNVRVDYVNRLYTVINVPKTEIDKYNLNTADIQRISQSYIKDFIVALGKHLDGKGLSELYKLYEIRRVDKYSSLVIIGFEPFDTTEYAKIIYYRILPIVVILLGILAIKFL